MPLNLGRGSLLLVSLVCAAACSSAPVIQGVTASPSQVAPGGTVTVTVLASEPNNVLSYNWTAPAGWTVVGGKTNLPAIALTAPAAFSQSAVVAVTVSDSAGNKVSSQVAVSTSADKAPVINSLKLGSDAISPGGIISIVASATSPTGLPLTYTWTTADERWGVTDLGSGVAALKAPSLFSASTILTLVVADSAGLTAADSTIVVTTPDQAPIVSSLTASASVVAPAATVTIAAVANSPTQSPLTYAWTSSNPLWLIAGNGPSATVTAPSTFSSTTVISVTATDGAGLAASSSIELGTSQAVAPVISSLTASPNPTQPQGTVTIVVSATSATSSTLNYTWGSSDPTWNLSANGNTATVIAPPIHGQTTVVSVVVTDATGLQTSDSVAVSTVADQAPTISAISASPNPVPPGGTATIAAGASSPSGSVLSYNWISSNPAWTITGTDSNAVVTAPAGYSEVTVVSVVVSDTNGLQASDSVVVSTTAAPTPQISQITWTPNNPNVNNIVTLSAVSNIAAVTGVGYLWSLTGSPGGSSAILTGETNANPTFIPDVSGDYQISLTITAAGVSSAPATTRISVGLPAPTAVITGNQTGAVNTPLALSGQQSTTPGGDPLAFHWSLFSAPTGGTGAFSADLAGTISGNTVGAPYFKGTLAGAYVIGLQVTDQVTGQSATTTLPLTLLNPGALTWIGGSSQTSTVNGFYGQPFVFQVTATDGTTQLAGLPISYSIWNGSATTLSTTTDAHGTVSFSVQAGRIAQVPGALTVWLTSNPTISASANFALTADQAAYVALLTPGVIASADFNVPVTVQVTDQFGNLSKTNPVANQTVVNLTVSGSAELVSGNTTAQTQQVQLSNGLVTVQLVDTVAEQVEITMSPASAGTQVLPYAAWQTTVYDSGQFQLGNSTWWSLQNSGSPPFQWQLFTDPAEANTGKVTSYGVSMSPSLLAFSGTTNYLLNRAVTATPNGTPGTATVVLTGFEYSTAVTGALDAQRGCLAQPALYATLLRLPAGTEFVGESGGNPVQPLGGYTAFQTCSGHQSFGSSPTGTTSNITNTITVPSASGWGAAEYDVTDAVLAGYDTLDLAVSNVANQNEPSQVSTFFADDVWTSSFDTYPLGVSPSAAVTLLPGAPRQIVMAGTSPPAFGNCSTTPPNQGFSLSLEEEDAFGNLVPGAATGTLSWAVQGTPPPKVTPVGIGPGVTVTSMPFALASGANTIAFQTQNFPASGQIAFTLVSNAVTSNMLALQETCHNNALGTGATNAGQWQDFAPLATYNVTEAMNACETNYGAGNCADNPTGHFVYVTNPPSAALACFNGSGSFLSCNDPEAFVWFYGTLTGATDVCGAAISSGGGKVTQVIWSDTCFVCVNGACPGETIGSLSSYVDDGNGTATPPWN